MVMTEDYRQRVIRMTNERNEFIPGDDGMFVYWPNRPDMGALTPADLRILADELDRLNAGWQAELDKYMEGHAYGCTDD
jgi:hypothetical protein